MEFSTVTINAPFKSDKEGVIRVGGTRVTLDSVISAFKNGSTCEEIVFQFPVLKLADVYSVISYYLNNQDKVEAYLEERERIAEKIKKDIQAHFDTKDIRQRLNNRRIEKEE